MQKIQSYRLIFTEQLRFTSDYVGKTLELTPVQSVLISLFINNSDNQRIELKKNCLEL